MTDLRSKMRGWCFSRPLHPPHAPAFTADQQAKMARAAELLNLPHLLLGYAALIGVVDLEELQRSSPDVYEAPLQDGKRSVVSRSVAGLAISEKKKSLLVS